MLNKKKIIITGNTSGIGLELNKLLIRNNHIIGISKSKSNIQNNLQVKVNLNNLNILKKKIFIKFKYEEGSPDGMTLDSKNNLWVCHFNGACISVFNKKGKKIHRINFPAKNITNCTFGGKNHNELFVSSATKSMSRKDHNKFKYSGSLFSIKTNMKGNVSKSFKVKI